MTLSATMFRTILVACGLLVLLLGFSGCRTEPIEANQSLDLDQPEEVLFWHFWGGRDKPVVDDVIRRFNASQESYHVRGIAMPGSNLDLKFFLSLAGGDPPDLMNHDDPIVADWAYRGAILPLDEVASSEEISQLGDWLYPAAKRLGNYDSRMYALVNGLDVRALYYNKTMLDEAGIQPPATLAELDQLAERFTVEEGNQLKRVGYLPDPRRIWAWGIVNGGRFFDPDGKRPSSSTPDSSTPTSSALDGQITLDSPENLAVLKWMASYAKRLGPDRIASFRTGDQALTGASFPLLSDRRYAAIMDGQWRVRDLAEAAQLANKKGEPHDEFGVIPLPPPARGLPKAGWVNGNFFIIPRGAKQPAGAWEFMKFWVGFIPSPYIKIEPEKSETNKIAVNQKKWATEIASQRANEAAETAAKGGWIPVSESVTQVPRFQQFLAQQPLFGPFVELASSPNQHPTPLIPTAGFYYREAISAAQDVMYRGAKPEQRLAEAAERVRRQYRSALASSGDEANN